MPFARVAGALLAVLVTLCACSGGSPGGPPDTRAPRLPDVALLSTTEGAPYTYEFVATGGVAPLRYAVATLPPGLSFYNGTGQLKGPATAAGEYSLTVEVQDAAGEKDSRTYALRVWPAPAVSTSSLPAAQVGRVYAFQLAATGGQAPLRWSVADGTLPPGLVFAEDGTLSGMPSGLGNYPLTLRVRDANGAQAQRTFTLTLVAGGDGGTPGDGGTQGDGGTPGPDAGTSFPMTVVNWNIEWFGDTTNGPTNEQLQFDNVKSILSGTGADLYALEEVVDSATFSQLKAQLPGYDGFLSDDSTRLSAGTGFYSAGEQKLGVLFKSAQVSVRRAEVILTANQNYEFAGRPPLRVDLRVTRNGASVDLVVIVLHLKAFSDTESYTRRKAASQVLKQYIDDNLPTARVLVLGDWNDDVDESISRDPSSGAWALTPFQNFFDAPTDYTFITRPLSLKGERSTVSHPQFIDHQLVSGELLSSLVKDSPSRLRPDLTDTTYGTTTSDHYPILSRFDFGQVASKLTVLAPNGGETLTGGSTTNITWSAPGVTHVRVEYSSDNGSTWSVAAASVPASSGGVMAQVPSFATTQALVRVSDASNPGVSDVSDGPFTVVVSTPAVFINEILAHEPPFPNSTTRDYDQQFVELVNAGTASVDLSGWRLHDASSYGGPTARHVFKAGTQLAPGKAYVVFSGSSAFTPGTPNTEAASSGGFFFNKGTNTGGTGDTVYLQDNANQVVSSHTYTATTEAVSFNRSPDASRTDGFVLHTTLPSGLKSSPGKRADGTSF